MRVETLVPQNEFKSRSDDILVINHKDAMLAFW
jgi:hypothetical protein